MENILIVEDNWQDLRKTAPSKLQTNRCLEVTQSGIESSRQSSAQDQKLEETGEER